MNEQKPDPKKEVPALFQDGGQLASQADAAAVARATQEKKAALDNPPPVKRFTRNDIQAKARIIQACQRKDLAEVSEYEYSRGGTRITGPTIDLLRAIANRWGNLRYGWTEVERREGASSVRCFAWDLQSNSQAERTFTVKHWRDTQGGGYAITDERDIYELMANMAARRVRACLEEVIDSDIVMAAIDQCHKTMRDGEKTPIADRAAGIVVAFTEFGVTQAMIETRLGNSMTAVSENQIASLRRIFKSLKDGVGKREDFFKGETSAPEFKQPETKPAEAATKPADPATVPPKPEPVKPEPVKPAVHSSIGKVRELCKASNITEGKLLEFLDAGVGTLEEVDVETLRSVIEQWTDISRQLRENLL
jgi:hypothetical protein